MANEAHNSRHNSRRSARAACLSLALGIACNGCGRIGFDAIDGSTDGAVLDVDLSDQVATDATSPIDVIEDARVVTDATSERDAVADVRRDAATDAPIVDGSLTRATLCSASGTIACIDFERDPPMDWTRLTSRNATLAFDTSRPFRGRAMHSTVPRSTETTLALLHLAVSSERFAAGLYVSAWVRAENTGSTTAFPVLEINNANRLDRMLPFAKVSLDHIGVPAVEGQFAIATPGRYLTGAGFPRGQWVCARLFVSSDGAGGMRTSVHANAQTIAVSHTFDPRGFETLQVGLVGTGDPGELWVDDVYVGSRDVGCLPIL